MDLIINFYKELDTLNLIIFWGIIIVIILLLIFSLVMINKNKKLKKIVAQKNKPEEELSIIKDEIIKDSDEKEGEVIIPISEEKEDNKSLQTMEQENNLSEKHISEYHQNNNNTIENKIEKPQMTEKTTYEDKTKQPIEIPTKPYQRNVLREMSLSQTSPIGINRQVQKEDKKMEMVKDLEESLNHEETTIEKNIITEIRNYEYQKDDNQIKEELRHISYDDTRKTDIKKNDKELMQYNNKNIQNNTASELLNNHPMLNNHTKEQNESEKYLAEVSRKLAEAEIPDEIERTNYELQQEEDAIISYKELMEKKDTIQTIDEEEAVISIEELMKRTNQKQEEKIEETKLYNLSEEEANDNFIKELKQFRQDL